MPSASALFVKSASASIASSPASVTIAIRPSSGVDDAGYKVICGFGKAEYFFGKDWTGRNSLIRLEKLDFTRKLAGVPAPPGAADVSGVVVLSRRRAALYSAAISR